MDRFGTSRPAAHAPLLQDVVFEMSLVLALHLAFAVAVLVTLGACGVT
jgi:hypothetical protein